MVWPKDLRIPSSTIVIHGGYVGESMFLPAICDVNKINVEYIVYDVILTNHGNNVCQLHRRF